jgi:hypothetical protein
VYEEFARNIPGFLPAGDPTFPPGSVPKPQPVGYYSVKRLLRNC